MPKTKNSRRTRRPLAVVTGAASGIGRGVVDVLLADGWAVAALDANAQAIEQLTVSLGPRDEVMTAIADVTDEPAVTALLAEIDREFGGIDGVVNSAGIAADKPALETPVDLFRKILDVNVVGSFIVSRVAARIMISRKTEGAIVNMASVSGLRGSKGRVAYGASKGAVVTMTQVLANDLAPHGIRVNAIAPGPIDTPLIKRLHTPADRKLWLRYVPANRYGAPEDVANAVSFLLDGKRSGFITATVLPVDGGFAGAGIITDRD